MSKKAPRPTDFVKSYTSLSDLHRKVMLNEDLHSLACEHLDWFKSDEEREADILKDVEEKIKKGANIDYYRPFEGSNLDAAIDRANLSLVRFLLNNGAKITNRTVFTAAKAASSEEEKLLNNKPFSSEWQTNVRRQIALAVIAKAPKEAFITAYSTKTVLDASVPSATITAAIKDALKKNGLKETNLYTPKDKIKRFAKQHIPGFGRLSA